MDTTARFQPQRTRLLAGITIVDPVPLLRERETQRALIEQYERPLRIQRAARELRAVREREGVQ